MNGGEKARARQLLATIAKALNELGALLDDHPGAARAEGRFDQVDGSRRRRPEWKRRGHVFYAIYQAGGRVSMLEFIQIVLKAGYNDMRGANGFFRGDPLPALERSGDDVVLTERGRDGARFYERYWLPQEPSAAS
jgi:hypothetical protein